MRARRELNRFMVDFPEAHFRSGKISHNCDAPSGLTSCVADASYNLGVFRRAPV
jgi:hypothetical protein